MTIKSELDLAVQMDTTLDFLLLGSWQKDENKKQIEDVTRDSARSLNPLMSSLHWSQVVTKAVSTANDLIMAIEGGFTRLAVARDPATPGPGHTCSTQM